MARVRHLHPHREVHPRADHAHADDGGGDEQARDLGGHLHAELREDVADQLVQAVVSSPVRQPLVQLVFRGRVRRGLAEAAHDELAREGVVIEGADVLVCLEVGGGELSQRLEEREVAVLVLLLQPEAREVHDEVRAQDPGHVLQRGLDTRHESGYQALLGGRPGDGRDDGLRVLEQRERGGDRHRAEAVPQSGQQLAEEESGGLGGSLRVRLEIRLEKRLDVIGPRLVVVAATSAGDRDDAGARAQLVELGEGELRDGVIRAAEGDEAGAEQQAECDDVALAIRSCVLGVVAKLEPRQHHRQEPDQGVLHQQRLGILAQKSATTLNAAPVPTNCVLTLSLKYPTSLALGTSTESTLPTNALT
eukprot:CAMPEP_0174893322 /NCGR_PEP_ID=MMETSP0167-20121228/8147_1 /TAXON_ID=38298 /ORGANISM="Rhodella maculata, Strain CCMP736" /LENGTH=362 /DNA_ID=CAMNT_0016132081 /DNA_START=541 /DNA_END=1626 /DNA_ORIENTATION=+